MGGGKNIHGGGGGHSGGRKGGGRDALPTQQSFFFEATSRPETAPAASSGGKRERLAVVPVRRPLVREASAPRRLMVLPDSDRVEEALLRAAEREPFVDASGFVTFAQLLQACDGARFIGRRACSPLAARAVVWGVAREHGGPFGPLAHHPAFARAALELFSEAKAGDLSPTELAGSAVALSSPRRERCVQLAALYRAYDARMKELGLADGEDVLAGAIARLEQEGLPEGLRRFGAVALEGLYDFSPRRLRFVLALAEACRRGGARLSVLLPGSGEPAIDARVDSVMREFERRWETLEAEVAKTDFIHEGRPLAPAAAHLFASGGLQRADGSLPGSPELGVEAQLSAFSAVHVRDEARQVARRIRALVDAGAEPESIVVAFRDLADEAEWLTEALDELGVRARARRGVPLASTTLGRLALDLPILLDEAFPAEGVARYLESRYVLNPSWRGPPPLGLLREASIRDDRWGARGAQGAYVERLSALADRVERAAAERGDLEGREPARWVKALASAIEAFFAACRRLPERAPASTMLAAWAQLIDELGLLRASGRGAGGAGFGEGGAFERDVDRAVARDLAAAEALRGLVEALSTSWRASGAGAQPVSLREFHRWLLDAAADCNLKLKGSRHGAVRVLDVREVGSVRCAHLFLGGLVEGRFPRSIGAPVLLSDDDRAEINRLHRRDVFPLSAGDGERRVPFGLAEDRLLFYLALVAAERTVTVSCARHDAEGREQTRSPFLDELCRAFDLRVEPLPLEPVPPLERVLSEAELRQRLARELFAPAGPEGVGRDASGEATGLRSALEARLAAEPWAVHARALTAMEWERLRFFSDERALCGPYSGAIQTPAMREALEGLLAFGPSRPLTASTLHTFGNCAFRGFLAHLLRLEEPEVPGEELDARGRGSFWHKVLELLFPRLVERELVGRAADELPEGLLDSVLAEAAAQVEAQAHVGHPLLWPLGQRRAWDMVKRLLGAEHRGLPFPELRPQRMELEFGRAGLEGGWAEVVVPPAEPGERPVYFKGKIDRLDAARGANGALVAGSGTLGVIDYKSRVDSASAAYEKMLSTEYQVPLYAYAARQATGAREVRGAWLSMRRAEVLELGRVLAAGEQTLDELLVVDAEGRRRAAAEGKKNLANAVHGLLSGLRAGQFPARPQDCGSCPYTAVCRRSERRVEAAG